MNYSKTILISIFLLLKLAGYTSCPTGKLQVQITIVPDNYPNETSWSLYDGLTNTLIDTGQAEGDIICVDSGKCLLFTIYDSYGDGMCCAYGRGHYTVKLSGTTVDSGGSFGYFESKYFNCAAGHDCSNPINAIIDTFITPTINSWYIFTPTLNGIYKIGTCALGNSCPTSVALYDDCITIVYPSDPWDGTIFYNRNGCADSQSVVNAVLAAHSTYYIRITGDTSCPHITWQIQYAGPITGCIDSTACNYNPLATVSDGNCIYPPNIICPAPDLAIIQSELQNSVLLDSIYIGPTSCYVASGCVTGFGMRRIIRFTTDIENIGNLDYYLGTPDSSSSDFSFDQCEHNWHYNAYAQYTLFDDSLKLSQVSFKDGCCVLDLACNSGITGKYGCNDQGITAGCRDVYSYYLDCQWLDITDVDTGNYTFLAEVNWKHESDALGHFEKNYLNNYAQLCLHLYYDSSGNKLVSVLPDCAEYVDCAGDTLGNSRLDCAGVCNGSHVMGDVNSDGTANIQDVQLYLQGIVNDTISYSHCIDLNGDGVLNATDPAWLNGCILFNEGLNNSDPNRKHCEFPFNLSDPFDTVTFSIQQIDTANHFITIGIYNPTNLILAYELQLKGALVDYVQNVATANNYNPRTPFSSSGHIIGIALDNNSLYRQLGPVNLLNVHYSVLTDTQICIEKVIDVVTSDYEEVAGVTNNSCISSNAPVPVSAIKENINITIFPNPSSGDFIVTIPDNYETSSLNITDALGRIVYHSADLIVDHRLTFSLGNSADGVYFLRLMLNGTEINRRITLVKK